MDIQRQRAIRRAHEAVPTKRPADWSDADYRHFETALADNGYELQPTAAEAARLAGAEDDVERPKESVDGDA